MSKSRMELNYFRLFEPFIVMTIMMLAMWEPKAPTWLNRLKHRKEKRHEESKPEA